MMRLRAVPVLDLRLLFCVLPTLFASTINLDYPVDGTILESSSVSARLSLAVEGGEAGLCACIGVVVPEGNDWVLDSRSTTLFHVEEEVRPCEERMLGGA